MTAKRQIAEWRLRRRLGAGGMGSVYLAESATGERAALKEIASLAEGGASPGQLGDQLMAEAKLLSKLVHPNIVSLRGVIRTDVGGYLVLELVEGGSVRDRLRRARLALAEGFLVMEGVLGALDHAHRNSVIHLDIKPENILMSRSGEVRVTDFGIARWPRRSRPAGRPTTFGTPQYMSPEQARGGPVDARSDLYSAGVLAYEIFCGRPPFAARRGSDPAVLAAQHVQSDPPAPSLVCPGIDSQLEAVIVRSLAKRPAERYQSARDFMEALNPIADRLAGADWQRRRPDSNPVEVTGTNWLAQVRRRLAPGLDKPTET